MRAVKFLISIFNVLALFALMSSSAQASKRNLSAPGEGSLCVLIFERDQFPLTKAVRGVYDGYPNTYVRTYATPKDILDCVHAGAKEVVIVAHLIELGKGGQFRLGYFENGPKGDSLHLMLNYPLKQLLELVTEQSEQNRQTLQKIRLMSCGPGEVMETYPVFKEIQQLVTFDQAPRSPIVSAIKGTNAVSFNKEWMAKDIDCQKLSGRWRTDKNNFCESDSWPGCDRTTAKFCLPAGN